MKKSQNKKKHNKMRNKHIWPTVVITCAILCAMIYAVTYSVHFIISYVIESKVEKLNEQTYRAALMIEQGLDNGKSIQEAINISQNEKEEKKNSSGITDTEKDPSKEKPNMPFVLDIGTVGIDVADIYVTDENDVKVASTSDKKPQLDEPILMKMSQDYYVYNDSSYASQKSVEELLNTSFGEILEWSLESDPRELRDNDHWMTEVVVEEPFWFSVYLEEEGYIVYIRCIISIIRQEFVYITMISIIALSLLAIPVIFLLINTIATIIRQRNISKLLYTDPVTEAHNWLWFQEMSDKVSETGRIRHVIMQVINMVLAKCGKKEIGRKNFALVDLQLHRYSNYCACSGVKEGEELLYRISEFLKARLQGKAVFCRHSNADFVIMMPCTGEDRERCEKECHYRLRTLLAELTGLPAMQKLHFHAGVYLIEDMANQRELDFDQLFTFAGYAIERGHEHCNEQIFFFDEQMLEEQAWLRFVEANMEEALENEEFQVYLQPKYSPSDRKIVAAEALVRWKHPDRGMVSPGLFIPIFEENGFITKLDDYMITKVAKLQAEWTLQKKKQVPVSINVSRAHFAQDGLADHICRLVDAYGSRHELIELEVTESAFFDDKEILTQTVKELKERGFIVSMDDFGAGYSSLNSLKDIPIDVLKLDGEFFRGNDTDKRGEIVVKEAIQLARNLQMRVVAEGIEKEEQVEFLTEIGCDMIQGFYFARPMPIAEYEELIEKDA